jgi:hypothetical protein
MLDRSLYKVLQNLENSKAFKAKNCFILAMVRTSKF